MGTRVGGPLATISVVTLQAGWNAANVHTIGDENVLYIHCREQNEVDIALSAGGAHFSIEANTTMVIPCMNSNGEQVFFRGTTGDHVEIWQQFDN